MAVDHLGAVGRRTDGRNRAKAARVGDDSAQRSRGGDRGRTEVDRVALRTTSPREVAVERANRRDPRRWSLSHADARTADGLEHARAGPYEISVDIRACCGEHPCIKAST